MPGSVLPAEDTTVNKTEGLASLVDMSSQKLQELC
jgi:hypothetical protein